MDSGCRGVNPAQVSSHKELLGTKRESDYNFGIAKVLFDAFVSGSVNYIDSGKVPANTLRQPGRRVPKIERVTQNDEHLHKKQAAFRSEAYGWKNTEQKFLSRGMAS